MAKKGSFSKVYDKNGDYVDVEAARFDGTRTFQMQGDVSATQTWNGDPSSPLTLNASIGAKKVTTDKINDKAVQTGQIDDGAVGLTQIATNAMNGTVQDNDSKLATHAAVKTYVDAQISGQGTYLGKHTVAEINAMVTDNLHNGDRVMTSDSGTINLGPGGVGFDVEAGEDLILYKSGSTVQWDSMDGNFKTKQSAVDDPTASGTGLTFIDSASQDENGEMTLSKKTVQDGTTSQKGVVQLEDSHSSTSTTKAATPNSVKEAYDLANTANTGAVKNVAYDSTNKKITKTINGTTSDVVSAATLKTDMALNNVDNTSDANKPVSTAQQAALDLKLDKTGDGKDVTATFTEASTRENIGTGEKLSVIFGKIKKWFSDLGTAAFKNVPASGDASSTEVVLGSDTRLSAGASAVQDVTVDGASVVNSSTKVAAVPNASTSAKGAVQLAGSIGATVASENNKAATEKAVRDAINALDAEVTSNDGTNVQVKVTEADGKISAVNVTTDNTENKNNKVSSWQTTPDDTHYPSEQLVKNGLDAKADLNKVVGVADATYTRENENGSGWNKLASIENFGTWRNNMGMFDLYFANLASITKKATLLVNVRWDSNRKNANIVDATIVWDVYDSTYKVAVVNRASSTSVITEIWAYLPKGNFSMALSYRSGSTKTGSSAAHAATFTDNKNNWSFFSYLATSVEKPTEDLTNFVKVKDADEIILQKNIATPTNNNLVAMDADGRIKDSGLTKSSVESAISSAGSAIQGVKVNNTTLTPDANKVVTVPLATTSADGAMSAADKTKLNGIAEGAEVNVQADWNETDSSSDAFIKNKPFYHRQGTSDNETVFIVCDMGSLGEAASVCYGIEILARYANAGIYGELIQNNGFKFYCKRTNGIAGYNGNLVRIYHKNIGNREYIYAVVGGSVSLESAPIGNLPKPRVDYTNFGSVISSLPEGATEITPVWVANSASSSGTAPVKVDAYGALSAVPMDSTPTASSTNLMTSGDIKTALDNAVANENKRYPFGVRQNRTTSYGYRLFNVKFSTAQSATRVRVSGNIVVGTTGDNERISFDLVIANVNTTENNPSAIALLTTSTRRGSRVVRLAYKRPSNWADGLDVFILWNSEGTATAANDTYGWEITQQEATQSSGVEVKDENLTSALTGFTLDSPRTAAITEGTSAIGSTSVPVYANENGVITPCTDDFARDSEVVNGVKLDGASDPLTKTNGIVTIPNAVATGTTGATNGLMTADSKAALDGLKGFRAFNTSRATDTPEMNLIGLYKTSAQLTIAERTTAWIKLAIVTYSERLYIGFLGNINPCGLVVDVSNYAQSGFKYIKVLSKSGYWASTQKTVDAIAIKDVSSPQNKSGEIYIRAVNLGSSSHPFAIFSTRKDDLSPSIVNTENVPSSWDYYLDLNHETGVLETTARAIQRSTHYVIDDGNLATDSAAGIVQYMTSAETTSMIAAAKAAAT